MALETLKGVEEIGGFPVQMPGVYCDPDYFNPDIPAPILVDIECNTISFKIQNGPIKEVGVNGCQVLTLIEAAKLIIEKLDDKYPCLENVQTLIHLEQAIFHQNQRTANREARNVEGTSQL